MRFKNTWLWGKTVKVHFSVCQVKMKCFSLPCQSLWCGRFLANKGAIIPHPPPDDTSWQGDTATLHVKGHVFCHPLNVNWLCNLLWPTKHNRSSAGRLLNLSHKSPQTFCSPPLSTQSLICEEAIKWILKDTMNFCFIVLEVRHTSTAFSCPNYLSKKRKRGIFSEAENVYSNSAFGIWEDVHRLGLGAYWSLWEAKSSLQYFQYRSDMLLPLRVQSYASAHQ